ncbi:MAG: hypothetical protein Q8P84_00985 [Deltaproteobacteria bacterium]|nr:hypothetical protein [Deltaproteobacteria bacterium]
MAQKINWEEILKNYPDQWVALSSYKETGAIEIEGLVIAHHTDRKKFYLALGKIRDQYPKGTSKNL